MYVLYLVCKLEEACIGVDSVLYQDSENLCMRMCSMYILYLVRQLNEACIGG
jgi:hypothetical protein